MKQTTKVCFSVGAGVVGSVWAGFFAYKALQNQVAFFWQCMLSASISGVVLAAFIRIYICIASYLQRRTLVEQNDREVHPMPVEV